ncbi:MAG: signal recognition particle-docking protein FtsY [Gammaproteobacteria bacterium]|nr:signal recognition particle-docking protein FtsY [Gammaproteobacteria bacterium]
MPLFKARRTESGSAQQGSSEDASLRSRLSKTRSALTGGLLALFGQKHELPEGCFDDLEDLLLSSDIGVQASSAIVEAVRSEAKRQRVANASAVLDLVRQQMRRVLDPHSQPLELNTPVRPLVVLIVGVNGVGKTTTTARLAYAWKKSGLSIMMAACDTFRAAAIEQLKAWGERLDVPVIAQQRGADAAAVAHDALTAAQARGCDVLLVDTAGRQHTHSDLMEQLSKIQRVIQKLDSSAPHEVLLVLDAATGQNALSQIDHFRTQIDVTGLCLTKLDGTAKGGVLLAITQKYGVPIRYIGVGEGMDDLREFDASDFVEALLPQDLSVGAS